MSDLFYFPQNKYFCFCDIATVDTLYMCNVEKEIALIIFGYVTPRILNHKFYLDGVFRDSLYNARLADKVFCVAFLDAYPDIRRMHKRNCYRELVSPTKKLKRVKINYDAFEFSP